MSGRTTLIATVAALWMVAACSSDEGSGGALVCNADQPVQCLDPSGRVTACCPLSHPICSADGTECLAQGGGASGATSSGGAPAGGAAGSTGGVAGEGGSAGAFAGSSGLGGSGLGGVAGAGAGGLGGSSGSSGGSAGTGGGTGAAGGSCTDVGYEPNETEATATDLGTINDCDGSGSSVAARLDGASDVDFYKFRGTDRIGCYVDPTAETGARVRICVFANCPGANVTCKEQSTPATSPAGYKGCCKDQGGKVVADLTCSSGDNADVYIRLDRATECTSYVVNYHY
jgi:hypothetical protein